MRVCEVCGKGGKGGQDGPGTRIILHHYKYADDNGGWEITGPLCYVCHSLLHGTAKIWHHPFADMGRDLGPKEFCDRVSELYREKLAGTKMKKRRKK